MGEDGEGEHTETDDSQSNAFIDLNKLFNLFHFLKLENWSGHLHLRGKSKVIDCAHISIHTAIWYSHFSAVSGGFISFFIFKITKQTWRTAGRPHGNRQRLWTTFVKCQQWLHSWSWLLLPPNEGKLKGEIIIKMMLVHKQAYSLIRIAVGSSGWFMLVLLMHCKGKCHRRL